MLLVFRVLQGLFTGTVTAYLTLVVSETPKERMGVAIGVMNSSVFLGNSVAPLMGGVFADWFGFRASFFVASGLLFASFLMSLFFVKEDFVPDKTRSFSFFSDIRTLLISGGILPLVGMMFLYGICRTMQQPVLPLFVQDIATDQSNLATQAGFVTSAAGMASILAGVIIGTLADRGKTLRIGVVCSALAGFVGIFVAMATQVWHLSLLFFISAFFIGGIDPILKIILAHIVPPEKRGSAFGILGSFRSFGWFTGSLSGGIIAAAFGLRSVFVIIALLFGLVAVLLSLMGRGKDY
jgi:DHA1 family multidrug resistance protein-like MFS transporter